MDQLLQLAQTLQLSPSLLQSMKILQMNTLELGQYLDGLAQENPAMEYQEGGEEVSWEEFSGQVSWLRDAPATGGGGEWDGVTEYGAAHDEIDSLEVFLKDQLSRLGLDPPLLALTQYLTGLLDHRGRLEADDLSDLVKAGVPRDLLDRGVATLQSLDPAGVGARSTGESLALQLSRLPGDHSLAIQICRGYLEDLAGQRYGAIAARLQTSQEAVRQAAAEIRSLDPDPVGDFAQATPVEYIRPDAYVAEVEGELRVFVNRWDLPRFHVSPDYLKMAKEGHGKEVEDYLGEKIRQAQWVLQCVQRRQSTLEASLTALVQGQEAYFLGRKEAPGPLLRRELAQQLQVHPSTVTRTLRNKYIQCRQGLFPTRYFFSRGVGREGQIWSDQAVKVRLSQLIGQEDPTTPLSDQTLVSLLEAEGIIVARRTVAKYRQCLGLPSSHRRKVKPQQT